MLKKVSEWAASVPLKIAGRKFVFMAAFSVVFIWFIYMIGPSPAKVVQNINVPKISIDLHPNRLVASPYNESKVAFLLEDRPIPHLAPLVLHMISVVPPDWLFLFVGSKESINFLNSSLPIQRYEGMGKLVMRELPKEATVHGQEEVSVTFTSLWFWKWLGGKGTWDYNDPYLDDWVESKDGRRVRRPQVEWMLVFQTDSIMCANAPKGLNDYLEWDYVGAPWAMHDRFGGNGGLSLRRVSRIMQVLEFQQRHAKTELEDLWLIQRMGHLPGAHMANTTVEASFSVENVWVDEPLGYHTGWSGARFPEDVWGTKEHREHIWKYCPEIKMILNMKLAVKCDDKDKRSIEADEDVLSGIMPW